MLYPIFFSSPNSFAELLIYSYHSKLLELINDRDNARVFIIGFEKALPYLFVRKYASEDRKLKTLFWKGSERKSENENSCTLE